MEENKITLMEALQVVTEEMKEYVDNNATDVDGAVVYNKSQNLTDPEKAQARENIGAPSISDIPTKTSSLNNDSNFLIGTDTTLTETGKAADAKAVGDAVSALPVTISDDGYSEVKNQRKIVHVQSTKTNDKVNVVVSLEGVKKVVLDVGFNANNYPTSLTLNGHTVTFGWSGF